MRLDDQERNAIKEAVKDLDDEIYVFGSRVDNNKKGGDIDILIFSDKKPFPLTREVSRRFFMLCEEKIDVIVMNPKQLSLEQKAFLNSIQMERFL